MATNTDLSTPSTADQNGTKKNEPDSSSTSTYASSNLRITKDCLYMILALRMEDFVKRTPKLDEVLKTLDEDREKRYKNVGAVLVSPNDVVWAADCSRDGVHAVARLLMKHYDKAEGCKMFMSRKPCSLCAKLLVQSKVKRVLYLPLKPEYYRDDSHKTEEIRKKIKESNDMQKNEVDNLFTASAIAQTRFVLQVEKPVVDEKKENTPNEVVQKVDEIKNRFTAKFIFLKDPEWLNSIKKELPWPAFDEMKKQVQEYFEDAMDWMARVEVLSGSGSNYNFKLSEDSKRKDGFDPEKNLIHEKQARHFMTMARFLAERTDDPTTGVGVVIVSYPKMEIVAFGWNGYPLKAHYGEFARGGQKEADKKYPYVIHAEQNALLMRNAKNIEGSILFVTKTPCHECAPLIAMEGISTVVKDDDRTLSNPKDSEWLKYTVFLKMVNDGKFVCYQTVKRPTDSKGIAATSEAIKEMTFSKEG